MIKTAKNPKGQIIEFNEKYHTYMVENQKLISVTQLISKFFPVFNTEKVSKSCAKKWDVSQDDLKAKWKKIADDANFLGNNVHNLAEALLNETDLPEITIPRNIKFSFQMMKILVKLLKRYDFLETEKIVFSTEMSIAGSIDVLFKKGNIILILDWKTGKKIETENKFNSYAFKPIATMPDNNFSKYSLQLNIYRHIMERENYFPGCKFVQSIVHITENDYKMYPVKNIDVEKMIKT